MISITSNTYSYKNKKNICDKNVSYDVYYKVS